MNTITMEHKDFKSVILDIGTINVFFSEVGIEQNCLDAAVAVLYQIEERLIKNGQLINVES